MKKAFIVLFFSILTNISFAENNKQHWPSALQLNELCNINQNFCAVYLAGFFDGMEYGNLKITKRITAGTLLKLFKKEMFLHPENGDENANDNLVRALTKYGYIAD